MTQPALPAVRRLAIIVRGVVQGVGFRPFVYNAAQARGLSGWVVNEAGVVRIEVQGEDAAIDGFLEDLRERLPPQARIEAMEVQEIPVEAHLGEAAFQICASEDGGAPRPTIPADLATCGECLAEIRDPTERRYNYPFTNCTNCGPRWSIIERLPYDRARTSMAAFAMCPECRAEYENPADRRFHSQPIACPRCGPMLQLLDGKGNDIAAGPAALESTARLLLEGRIVAMKGLGGFQLLCDATNAEAVALLRHRKRRPDRPFAIMVATLEDARACCKVSEEEAHMLASHQSPIVLLRRRADEVFTSNETRRASPAAKQSETRHSPLATLAPSPNIAPENPYLGVMLPYTPLHHLLLAAAARPLVCTSGNLSEEPMAIEIDDALRRLGPIADAILTHNRPIVRPVDDSIVRCEPDGPQVLRRARGFAPVPISSGPRRPDIPVCLVIAAGPEKTDKNVCPPDVPTDKNVCPLADGTRIVPATNVPATVLAVGGHLKNTVALALSDGTQPTQVVMSAHIGDLESVASIEVFRRAIDDLVGFFQVKPDAIACDLHPDYASTRCAEELARQWNVPLIRVQHHHAHVAACMAEHGLSGPVLGFAWDGIGYGPDGAIWGGETLLCDGSEFQRIAHLRTFALPGGEIAAREPRRSALGLLYEMLGSEEFDERVPLLGATHSLCQAVARDWFTPNELSTLRSMLEREVNSPRTSSMGRLFDAVAAICGLPPTITFEGQAAMALEFAAMKGVENAGWALPTMHETAVGNAHPTELIPFSSLDWEPIIRNILADRAAGVPVEIISLRFHNAIADMALSVARAVVRHRMPDPTETIEQQNKRLPIVLSGGCFQNALLTDLVRARLSGAGFKVYTHKQVPPGDGGIALGQAFVALERLRSS